MNKEQIPLYAAVLSALMLAVAAICAYLLPHQPLAWQIILGVALVSGGYALVAEREALLRFFSKKTTIYGLNSLLMAALVFAIVVVVNMISVRYDKKLDFTKNKLHTLSEQSIKVVKGLDQEIRLRAFISPMQRAEFEQIFDKYTYYSDKLKQDFVDVDKNVFEVEKYEIKRTGTVVVESDTRSTKLDSLQGPDDPNLEQKLTNAIIQVAKGTRKKAYFVSGHGELLVSDTSARGYSQMKEALTNGRFTVEELILVDKASIPEDAEIVVIPGPRKAFLDHETKMLEAYLKKGGKVLLMLEPDSSPSLQPLLKKFGVKWTPKRTVAETNVLQRLAGGNPLTPIVTSYEANHEITRDLRQLSIFAIAAPVETEPKAPTGVTITKLFSTSPQSFEVEYKKQIKLDQRTARKGPISLALVAEGPVEGEEKKEETKGGKVEEPTWRLVVVGDADFASNSFRDKGVNSDLFLNMMSWLSEEEDLIAIRPKATNESKFEITEARFRVINLASVVFAPLLMFLSGIGVWLQRRRK